VKLVIVEKFEPPMLDSPGTISDIKGNFKQGIAKGLLSRNHKGLTPLACAIE